MNMNIYCNKIKYVKPLELVFKTFKRRQHKT